MTLQTLFRPANNFTTTFSWKIQQDKTVPHCSEQFKRLQSTSSPENEASPIPQAQQGNGREIFCKEY